MAETKKTTTAETTAKKKTTTKTTATKTATTKTAATAKSIAKTAAPKAEVKAEAPVATATTKTFDGPMVKITQVRSGAGRIQKQQKTLVALGLKKIGQSVVKKDNAQTRGMIYVVAHLVKVEKV